MEINLIIKTIVLYILCRKTIQLIQQQHIHAYRQTHTYAHPKIKQTREKMNHDFF